MNPAHAGAGTYGEAMSQPGARLDWNLVRTFVAVVETGSLAGAARRLTLAHPTVARHIQQLESQLQLSLFERRPGGLVINDAGERLSQVAARMQKDAVAFESVSEFVKTTTTGKVRVTVAEPLAEIMPEVLAPLREFSGKVQRHIELVIAQEQLNLLEREADIAVRHVRPVQAELVCRKVGKLPMAAWASASYIEEHGVPSADTLHRHWFIDGVTRQFFAMALAELGHPIPETQIAFCSDSMQAQRRAAEMGWGIVGLPNYVAEETPGLVRVMSDQGVQLDIWLVARTDMRQQMLLRLVYQHLATELQNYFADLPSQRTSVLSAQP